MPSLRRRSRSSRRVSLKGGRRTSRRVSLRRRKSNTSRRVSMKGGRRKLNAFFKAMLSAKRQNAASFSYKGKTYVGRKHARLGMIYKRR